MLKYNLRILNITQPFVLGEGLVYQESINELILMAIRQTPSSTMLKGSQALDNSSG